MAKKEKRSIGSWAFLVGFVIAIVFGILGSSFIATIAWLLVVLGLIIGFLNITEKETDKYMYAGAVLVIVSAVGADAMNVLPIIGNILNAILLLFIPSTIIVALKEMFAIAKK